MDIYLGDIHQLILYSLPTRDADADADDDPDEDADDDPNEDDEEEYQSGEQG